MSWQIGNRATRTNIYSYNHSSSFKKGKNTKADWNRWFTTVKNTKERKNILTNYNMPVYRTWGGSDKNIYGYLRFERDLLKVKYIELFHYWS